MKWIELHTVGGSKVTFSASVISAFMGSGEGTQLFFLEKEDSYIVKESYEQIKAMLTGGCYVGGSAKHSRWSMDEYGDCVCENCGWESSEDSDFCPGCGADMREEGEGHEAD